MYVLALFSPFEKHTFLDRQMYPVIIIIYIKVLIFFEKQTENNIRVVVTLRNVQVRKMYTLN